MVDLSTTTPIKLHAEMTEALRDALSSGDPVGRARALCEEWESVHAERKQQHRRIQAALRKAEAHFRFEEVEKLQAELAALEI